MLVVIDRVEGQEGSVLLTVHDSLMRNAALHGAIKAELAAVWRDRMPQWQVDVQSAELKNCPQQSENDGVNCGLFALNAAIRELPTRRQAPMTREDIADALRAANLRL